MEFDAATGGYLGTPGGRGYESGSSWSGGAVLGDLWYGAACGLLELAEHVKPLEKQLYIQSAIRCLKGAERFCRWEPDVDAVLDYGSARYDRAADRHVPLIYGDYF